MLGSLFPFRLLLVDAVVTVDIVVRGGSVSVPRFELKRLAQSKGGFYACGQFVSVRT